MQHVSAVPGADQPRETRHCFSPPAALAQKVTCSVLALGSLQSSLLCNDRHVPGLNSQHCYACVKLLIVKYLQDIGMTGDRCIPIS